MKTIIVNEKEYVLEYTFMAAEHKDTVQKMFNVVSGAYIFTETKEMNNASKESVAAAMISGTGKLVADIPHIVKTAFYSGLLENNAMSEEEAYDLMKEYMKENKISFRKLFEDIKMCMEDDGFFDLSGLTEMMKEMGENVEKNLKKSTKTPQDHKKKSTSTK